MTHPILIGCSGWSYPEWAGPFYPEGMDSGEYLGFYADRFAAVEVDSSFYRVPTARMVRAWRDRTPEGFRFLLKVPRRITHDKQLADCEPEIREFAAAVTPLGDRLAGALLQMGYFNRAAFASSGAFLERLDGFLSAWPIQNVPLAVEIRNPRWLGEDFAGLLRSHGAVLTLTDQKWMPRPGAIMEQFDPVTGPFSVVRLLGDREAIEKLAPTWDRNVIDRRPDLTENAEVVNSLARRVPTFVFINNHYAGFAPQTAAELRSLLGLEAPVPPERPRTTLFD